MVPTAFKPEAVNTPAGKSKTRGWLRAFLVWLYALQQPHLRRRFERVVGKGLGWID